MEKGTTSQIASRSPYCSHRVYATKSVLLVSGARLFDSILSLMSTLVRGGTSECCECGRAMYITGFCVLNDVCFKQVENFLHSSFLVLCFLSVFVYDQELLGSLLGHIGSGNNEAINCALVTLQDLTQGHFERCSREASFLLTFRIKPLAGMLQSSGIVDYSETSALTFEQIRQIYVIFTDLAYQRVPRLAVYCLLFFLI